MKRLYLAAWFSFGLLVGGAITAAAASQFVVAAFCASLALFVAIFALDWDNYA
jgi:hypothetical protein